MSKIPDFEVGDLIQVRVTGKEEEGYSVEMLTNTDVSGYYPSKLDIESGTRIEACFVCLDGGRLLLAPKSFLKNRQQLTAGEMISESPDFAPKDKVAPPDGDNAIDFSPPSKFEDNFVSLLLKWQLISQEQESSLKEQLRSGKWEIVGLLKRLNIFTPQELSSIDIGRNLLKREKVSWTEFKKAFFDEVSAGIILEDSRLIKSKK